jgi:hypothetical protein
VFKSELLNINIKPTVREALIRRIVTYTCLAMKPVGTRKLRSYEREVISGLLMAYNIPEERDVIKMLGRREQTIFTTTNKKSYMHRKRQSPMLKYCHDLGDRLVTGFIGHLQLVIIIHYCTVATSHILQFTTARTDSSRSIVSPPVVW